MFNFEPPSFQRLYKIAHSESTVDYVDNPHLSFLGLNGRVRPWLPLLVQNAQLWPMRRLREDGDLNHLQAASICEAPTGARKANLNGVPLLR